MNIDIMTLFPDSVDAMLHVSILGRAIERGYISIRSHQIREYTTNKQMQVDDYPYGGGRGAVMQADPLYRCWAHIVETYGPGRTIFMSPCGRTFNQAVARELKENYDHLILVFKEEIHNLSHDKTTSSGNRECNKTKNNNTK